MGVMDAELAPLGYDHGTRCKIHGAKYNFLKSTSPGFVVNLDITEKRWMNPQEEQRVNETTHHEGNIGGYGGSDVSQKALDGR